MKINKKSVLFYSIYLVGAVLVILSIVEFVAFTYNKSHFGRTYPFLVNKAVVSADTPVNATIVHHAFNVIDPHMGVLWNASEHENFVKYYKGRVFKSLKSIPGFAYYGDPAQTNNTVIVTLGGSTTQAHWYPSNWSDYLYQQIIKNTRPSIVYNGGVAGFTSNQEVFKLIRDGLTLKPNIVITYDGINDIGFFYSLPKHPMITPYQEQLMNYLIGLEEPSLILPNTMYFFKRSVLEKRKTEQSKTNFRRLAGTNFGPEVNTTAHEQWARNHKIMHAVCEEFGIKYFAFLQPVLGIGKYSPSQAETDRLEEYDRTNHNNNYRDKVSEFYKHARRECSSLPYCTDLTDVFAGKSDLYTDVRHLNEKGNEIIAEAIYNKLNEKNAFQRRLN